MNGKDLDRRDFIRLSAGAAAAFGALGTQARAVDGPPSAAASHGGRAYNVPYEGDRLARIAFPLGGIGAGTICVEGTGALSHLSLRNHPEVDNGPPVFAAISVKAPRRIARVLEGPVPAWKLYGRPGTSSGNSASGPALGLARFRSAVFKARFPFADIALSDPDVPVSAVLTAWSPFEPGDADNSSLPVAALEYSFSNGGAGPVDAVFSFHSSNFLAKEGAGQEILPAPGGFTLHCAGTPGRPWDEASFSAWIDDPGVKTNHAWFRGTWFDSLSIISREIQDAACYARPPVTDPPSAPGASLFLPFSLAPGETKVIAVRLAWHSDRTDLHEGKDLPADAGRPRETHRPWYAGRFPAIGDVASHWNSSYIALRAASERFSNCFFGSTLPPEVIEAVSANLSILKSPTILRQADGRLWGWEGCDDFRGQGDLCTHVWNYAQSIPHLFPSLERTLRETEVGPSQEPDGEQTYRSGLPIRPIFHQEYDAADGQLGGIIKVHREWRISGDTDWLRRLWPKVRVSLDYSIRKWDPNRRGILDEPQHNTYDIEFWGPNGMCTSIYLGALRAATLIGHGLGDDVGDYADLYAKGRRAMEEQLFDGEYFVQRTEWKNLRAKLPKDPKTWTGESFSAEATAQIDREGPNYQIGPGCLSDGVIGSWFATVCGLGRILDPAKVRSHLSAVHRHNFKRDLSAHFNPERPTYACGAEGGLLLCTWPKGGRPTLPMVYSDEVWTGIEYQVASHLMSEGFAAEGLEIVRACRDRYDGRIRNPFGEYEWGLWYARAMASYALLQGLSGARYDAVDKVLHLEPGMPGDFRSFLATATGYGSVGVRDGRPFFDPASGSVEIREIRYKPRG